MHIMQKFTRRIICWYIVFLDQSATWSKLDPKFASLKLAKWSKWFRIQLRNFSRLGMVRFPFPTRYAIGYCLHNPLVNRTSVKIGAPTGTNKRSSIDISSRFTYFPIQQIQKKSAMQIQVDNYDHYIRLTLINYGYIFFWLTMINYIYIWSTIWLTTIYD